MGAAGGKLTGAGPGTGRKRVRTSGINNGIGRSGLTEEVAGAGESVNDGALGLACSGGDGVGRDHGLVAGGPDAVVGQDGAVAAGKTLGADPLLHEGGVLGEGGVGHGVGDDTSTLR